MELSDNPLSGIIKPNLNTNLSQVIAIYNGETGALESDYAYGLERVSVHDEDTTTGKVQDPLYYLYNGTGNVSELTNTAGHVSDKYRFDPYGVGLPGGKMSPNAFNVLNNPFGYTGEMNDPDANLTYLRNRYYEPETGVFMTRDLLPGQLLNPLTLNAYAYVTNNPLNFIDPLGLEKGYKGTGKIDFGSDSYLKDIERIYKESGEWVAMKKVMGDIHNNRKLFMQEDYDKLIPLYDKIDFYAKYILGNPFGIYSNDQRKEVHYFRNEINRQPLTLTDLVIENDKLPTEKQWKILGSTKSAYHMQGDNGLYNLKFISADGRFEAVYNEKGQLVNDTKNMGTYNYAPSTTEGDIKHFIYDMDPYHSWGNTPDSTQKVTHTRFVGHR